MIMTKRIFQLHVNEDVSELERLLSFELDAEARAITENVKADLETLMAMEEINEALEAQDIGTDITDGEIAIMAFETWQEMILSGELPDTKRYEKEMLKAYGNAMPTAQAPYYILFMGFLGGMDFTTYLLKNWEEERRMQP